MMKPFFAAAALAAATFAAPANAVLISLDSSFGPNTITLDTNTGLRWLDLTASLGESFDDVTAELGAGGDFQGFRYALAAEVETLYTNAGIPMINGGSVQENVPAVTDLIGLLGMTDLADLNGSFGTRGLIGEAGVAANSQLTARLRVRLDVLEAPPPPPRAAANVPAAEVDRSSPDREIGSFLVQTPEPSALVGIVSGIAALGLVMRRRAAS